MLNDEMKRYSRGAAGRWVVSENLKEALLLAPAMLVGVFGCAWAVFTATSFWEVLGKFVPVLFATLGVLFVVVWPRD